MKNGYRETSQIILINFLIILVSYSIINIIKFGKITYYEYTGEILSIFLFVKLFLLFTIEKTDNKVRNFYNGLFYRIKIGIYNLFFISFLFVIFNLYSSSRLLLFGTSFFIIFFELIIYSIGYIRQPVNIENPKTENNSNKMNYLIIIFDIIIWTSAFWIVNHIIIHVGFNDMEFRQSFILMSGLWLCCSIFSNKFKSNMGKNFWYSISPLWKTTVLIGTATAFLRIFLRGFLLSNIEVFLILFTFLLFEVFVLTLYFLIFRISKGEQDFEGQVDISTVFNDNSNHLERENFGITSLTDFVEKKKVNNTITNLQELIEFIADIPRLKSIKSHQTITYDTEHLFNIEKIKKHSLHLLINLHDINSFPAMNRYFLTIYKKLVPGGYFVSKIKTIKTHRQRFFTKYPKFMSHFFYFLHFVFNRIFPYVPVFDKIYNLFTGGKRSVISEAEALGRLHYCGYKVISTHNIGDYLYFVSQKVNIPALKESPSKSILIKLKRIGMNGKVFNLFKLRTMYPYSEYLQEYVYELNKLQENGKILDDFRITGWGRVFRKFWIDELPQLINYFRGDIGIFGARALSHHYFHLYPQNLRELRIQFKNGLVPPYYADMPKNFDEIVKSEERYFEQKLKKPFITDIIYFFRAFDNIILKKARSM